MTGLNTQRKVVGRERDIRETERGEERERDGALQRKGFGDSNKLDNWTNIYDS